VTVDLIEWIENEIELTKDVVTDSVKAKDKQTESDMRIVLKVLEKVKIKIKEIVESE
jgi:hypothetical protein